MAAGDLAPVSKGGAATVSQLQGVMHVSSGAIAFAAIMVKLLDTETRKYQTDVLDSVGQIHRVPRYQIQATRCSIEDQLPEGFQ